MTSVSIPVYNKKNQTVRIAELLGVAGTDVPIAEIEKLIPLCKLGVNGYSFAVNNNGYVLYHPDLRPMFQEILKPNYNSVDFAEVELVHNPKQNRHDEPRYNDSGLFMMRKDMVDQQEGMQSLKVKVHLDDMKRVTVREQDYFYYNISNTPFTLGIALPTKYGKYRVRGGLELNQKGRIDVNKLFPDERWKLHPDWVYCEYNYAGQEDRRHDTPEKNMRHFLERLADERASFNWGTSRVRPLPKCQGNGMYSADCPKSAGIPTAGKHSHYCDKELVEALVLDAEITQIFTEPNSRSNKRDLFKQFGIDLSFVATRSGLTRWEEHKETDEFADEEEHVYDEDNPKEPHFSQVNNEATDEVWYERAVEYHFDNPNSFVFSVPFDIGDKRPTTVTATHAVFKDQGGRKAPAAVVGVQIDYDRFAETFMDVTTNGPTGAGYQTKSGDMLSCKNESIECYVLDNNGFVVISEDPNNIGKFFGEIDGTILNSLEQNHVFKKIKIYDYQAICLENADDGSPASIILTPFKLITWLFNWLLGQMAWTIIRFELHHLWNPDWTYAFPQTNQLDYAYAYADGAYYDDDEEYEYRPEDYNGGMVSPEVTDNEEPAVEETEHETEDADEMLNDFKVKDGGPIPLLEMTYINKTQPRPCDKEAYLYELNEGALKQQRPLQGILRNCHESNCERPFSVTQIPNTNLVLIVADKMCPCYSARISVTPSKVDYGPKNETAYCEKLKHNLYRQKPRDTTPYHVQEEEISLCGGATSLIPPFCLMFFSLSFLL